MSTTVYKIIDGISDDLKKLSECQQKEGTDTEQASLNIDLEGVIVEIDVPSRFGVEIKEAGEKLEQFKKSLEWLGERAKSLTITFNVNPRKAVSDMGIESMLPRMLGVLERVKVKSLCIVEPIAPDALEFSKIAMNMPQTVVLFTALVSLLERNPHIQHINQTDFSQTDWFNRYANDSDFHYKHLHRKINSLILKNKGFSLENLEKVYESLEEARHDSEATKRDLATCSENMKKYVKPQYEAALSKVEEQLKKFNDTIKFFQEKGVVEANYYLGQELQRTDPEEAYRLLSEVAAKSTLALYSQKAHSLIATMLTDEQCAGKILPLLHGHSEKSSVCSSESLEDELEKDGKLERERKSFVESECKGRAEDRKRVVEEEDIRRTRKRLIAVHALEALVGAPGADRQDCESFFQRYAQDYVYDQGSLDINTVSPFERLPKTGKVADVAIFLMDLLHETAVELGKTKAQVRDLENLLEKGLTTTVTPSDLIENKKKAEVQAQLLQDIETLPTTITIPPGTTKTQTVLRFSSGSSASSSISTIRGDQSEREQNNFKASYTSQF